VDAYLREIAKAMSESLLGNTSGIEIEVKAEPLEIDPERAVPFGLLVNELTKNAIKHAFPQGQDISCCAWNRSAIKLSWLLPMTVWV
jgi:two-component sensor histidine kinase